MDWVFLGSYPDALESPALEQRARAAIRAAFVEHMGGDTADASALVWPEEYLPLPDPESFMRNLTEEELLGYKKEAGTDGRECILAQNELRRRRRPSPLVMLLWGAASLLVIAYWLWRWLGA